MTLAEDAPGEIMESGAFTEILGHYDSINCASKDVGQKSFYNSCKMFYVLDRCLFARNRISAMSSSVIRHGQLAIFLTC